MDFLNQYEITVLEFIRDNLHCAFLDSVFPIITKLGDHGMFWILLAAVLLCFKKTRKAGFTVGFALILGLVFGNCILKPLIDRTRPYEFSNGFNLLIPALKDASFPSGHTLASFEAAGALMLTDRKRLGIPALVLAVLIAVSRLYLCVHYPTDVLAGMVLGLLFAYASYKFIGYIYSRKDKADTPEKS